jgi:transposase
MVRREEPIDEQWSLIEPLFDKPAIPTRGSPRRDEREILNGVLWIFYEAVLVGRIYPIDFRHTKPAIADSKNGFETAD